MYHDEPHHTPVQAALVEQERNRRERRRRTLFWSAEAWERCLAACRAEQVARDAALQQALDDPQQRAAVPELYRALEHDVAWYGWLHRELRQLRDAWLGDQHVGQALVDELVRHEQEVEYWFHDRHVRMYQVALEFLERRRAVDGRLPRGAWAEQWADLQRALHAQSIACVSAYAGMVPPAVRLARLRWLERLSAIQAETRRAWARVGGGESAALDADMAIVAAELAQLQPPAPPRRSWPWSWRDAGVAAALGLSLMLVVGVAFARQSPPAESPPVLRGSFVPLASVPPQTGQGPLVPTATPDRGAAMRDNEAGEAWLAQGNYAAAEPLFAAAAAADPTFYEPPNNLAFCRWEQGDASGAIELWEASLKLNPDNADAAAALGTALYIAGDHQRGIASYRRAIALKPGYADVAWLRGTALWSERIIADSEPLRALLAGPAVLPAVK